MYAGPGRALRDAADRADAIAGGHPKYHVGHPGVVLKNAIDRPVAALRATAPSGQTVHGLRDRAGQYGGVWARTTRRVSPFRHRRATRAADSVCLSVPAGTLDGRHPREAAELVRAGGARR